jgi:hypothetical protein
MHLQGSSYSQNLTDTVNGRVGNKEYFKRFIDEFSMGLSK